MTDALPPPKRWRPWSHRTRLGVDLALAIPLLLLETAWLVLDWMFALGLEVWAAQGDQAGCRLPSTDGRAAGRSREVPGGSADEDCLHPNVTTPGGAGPECPRPVIVWLHGRVVGCGLAAGLLSRRRF
ncbi:DUF6234 family protein [Streptomyces sp. Je 1-4]|nr:MULTISPECIES: DUF6234 family protein [unclassified Streptomyces]UYB37822.1 DUF6234 family protein [Streptomyces sp. Je 1-4]UZQ33741.1 DUF6234 family protein [Streptomyces sp. Je 1-4] [Streptomyces sp. Je 1-4 4N24]UZQ41159.1 DUF6234 family protein [Streptomyces sp. Je 1-4] [Streptomyces sp. Je 1-4 4N24_ara]